MTAVAVQPAIRKGPSSMRVFHDTWLVFRRSLGLTVRQPAWLIAGVMQPFVYLILFGPLLDSLSSVPGFPAGGAFNTFVPGLLVMTALWLGSWFAQSVAGWSSNNADRIEHQQPPISLLGYLGSADFWQTTLQNWQSEFLAVGSMAVLSIYLRQRGSSESKPVGAPHSATGVEG